jgi:hypothetical protein
MEEISAGNNSSSSESKNSELSEEMASSMLLRYSLVKSKVAISLKLFDCLQISRNIGFNAKE